MEIRRATGRGAWGTGMKGAGAGACSSRLESDEGQGLNGLGEEEAGAIGEGDSEGGGCHEGAMIVDGRILRSRERRIDGVVLGGGSKIRSMRSRDE